MAGERTSRVPLRTAADTEGEVQRVLGKLEARGNDLGIVRAVANSPNGFRPFVLMGDALLAKGSLPARTRELVVLGLAAEGRNAYEWTEHRPVAERAGVTPEECAALRAGGLHAEIPTLSDDERLALAAAAELHAGATSDATFERMVAEWGRETAVELVFCVAWWGAFVPTIIEGLGLSEAVADGTSGPTVYEQAGTA